MNGEFPLITRTIVWSRIFTEVVRVPALTQFGWQRNEEGSECSVDAHLEYDGDRPQQVDDGDNQGYEDL